MSYDRIVPNFLKFLIEEFFYFSLLNYISGSQTFLVRGPLRKIWWSAKDKILNYIGIRGPLQLISRTTSGPRSRLWESLNYILLLIIIFPNVKKHSSLTWRKQKLVVSGFRSWSLCMLSKLNIKMISKLITRADSSYQMFVFWRLEVNIEKSV